MNLWLDLLLLLLVYILWRPTRQDVNRLLSRLVDPNSGVEVDL
jgi:hypothetical protein